jgi:hypothetical protein
MTPWNTPIRIPVQPWFADHCFMGKVVLPAVETMLLLAAAVAEVDPAIDMRVMSNVRFSRFLEIPEGATAVEALIEFSRHGNGALQVKLLSRKQLKSMARLREHAEILFLPAEQNRFRVLENAPETMTVPEVEIPAEVVYRDLVPFGRGYQTLRGALLLAEQGAWGRLQAPDLAVPGKEREIIGSPFPLDGAFHAACVLGQRKADFVPFPVGFDRRIVVRPTRPGGSYCTKVDLLSAGRDELLFDLSIFDDAGQVYERISGVRMRDVSGGKIKPPAWLKERKTMAPG